MKHFWTTAAVTALCALSAPAWAAPQTQYLHLTAEKHLRGAQTADSAAKSKKHGKAGASKSKSKAKSSKASRSSKSGKASRAESAHAKGRHKSRADEATATSSRHGRGRHHGRSEEAAPPEHTSRSARGRKAAVSHDIHTAAPAAVKVGKGDTLISIAKKTGVSTEELARLNGLKKPYHVRIGARIKLPAERYYVVKSGDTIYSLARKFKVDASDLSDANKLGHGKSLRSGQRLFLPSGAEEPAPPEAPPERAPRPSTRPVRTAPPVTYQPSPELYTPPQQLQTTSPPAAEQPPSTTMPVQPRPAPAYTSPPTYVPTTPPAARPGAQPPAAQGFEVTPERPRAPVYPATPYQPQPQAFPGPSGRAPIIQTNPPPSQAEVVAAGRGKFNWPAAGNMIAGFGPKSDGQRNDGVNIAAPAGDPVRAAADGEVVYAGDQVPSFGNLVLVKHPGGWVTAYAHMSRILVKNRDQVVQGQQLGVVGQTGSVDSPQLHFEIRYAPSPKDKAAPVDPMLLLPNR